MDDAKNQIMNKLKKLFFLFLSFVAGITISYGQQLVPTGTNKKSSSSPHLQIVDGVKRLLVEEKPFLVLGGELHNSSSSSLDYMDSIWPKLVQMNLNTILVPVSWDLIEPKEGQFNFELIDGLIKNARKNNLKIAFLWFGSWKNMVSSYAPEWVKNNPERFPLLIAKDGERFQMLSTFSQQNIQADSKAFAALMKHIKQVDSVEQTVIMMQVENEVGTNGGERDHSKAATKAYESEVPEKLISYLQKNKSSLIPEFKQVWAENGYKTKGNWPEIFGESGAANEIFMAWSLASYIGEVIKAGKSEYNIPMFVNASVGRQDEKLATYPSGGPVPFVMDIWHAAAPELDMVCPDIYYGDFTGHCRNYTQSGNPLFIPETRAGDRGAANALLALGNFNAIGFSPFGIDGRIGDTVDDKAIPQVYSVMSQLSPFLLNSKANQRMIAVSVDTTNASTSVDLGAYQVDFGLWSDRWSNEKPELGYAILIEVKPGEFIAAGKNISIQFSLKNRNDKVTGILWAEEGKFENGEWISDCRLNGDEIMVSYSFSKLFEEGKSGNGLKFNNAMKTQRVKLYTY